MLPKHDPKHRALLRGVGGRAGTLLQEGWDEHAKQMGPAAETLQRSAHVSQIWAETSFAGFGERFRNLRSELNFCSNAVGTRRPRRLAWLLTCTARDGERRITFCSSPQLGVLLYNSLTRLPLFYLFGGLQPGARARLRFQPPQAQPPRARPRGFLRP